MRKHIFSGIAILFCTIQLNAMDGTALVVSDGRTGIVNANVTTGMWDTIVAKSDLEKNWGIYGPCFSPDGKRIAFSTYRLNSGDMDGSHILVADNDGGNITYMCQAFRTGAKHKGGISGIECSWANNGCIYWSEDDDNIYRINVVTKQPEKVASMDEFSGSKPERIDNLKVSLDAARGGCMVNGGGDGRGIDFGSKTFISYGGGCQVTPSPDGKWVTRNTVNAISGYGYHQVAFIHNFTTTEIVDTIFAPGAVPNGERPLSRFVFHRFSHSSNDHVVFTGEDGLSGKGYVHNLKTNETVLLGECTPYDFWAGELPPPPSDGPRISIDSTEITFIVQNGIVPSPKVVTVINAGNGTLDNVDIQGAPSWLTIVRGGSGNTQTLTNSVDPGGLSTGIHNATITISGGGASNSENYTVTLNVAQNVLAPSKLNATAHSSAAAQMTWTDNSDNENGFAIERKITSKDWEHLVSVAANDTSYIDSPLTSQTMYHYRVRAFIEGDSSGWSNEDSLELALVKSITLLSPAKNDVWEIGTTQHITWSTKNVSQVDLYYSINGGRSLLLIADNSIKESDDEWGNFPWTIPQLDGDSIIIVIREYGNPDLDDRSEKIALVSNSPIKNSELERNYPSYSSLVGLLRRPDGSALVNYNVTKNDKPVLHIYQINGSLVAEIALATRPGSHSLVLNGSTMGPVFGEGLYILHLTGYEKQGNDRLLYYNLSR